MWPPEEHERLIENMSAWMDGELPDIASTPEAGGPDDLELEVAEHQACCPSCRDLFEELKELRAGFETLPEPDPPEGFAQSVLDRIRAEARPKVIPCSSGPRSGPWPGWPPVWCWWWGCMAHPGPGIWTRER